jgi:hypothetical protein
MSVRYGIVRFAVLSKIYLPKNIAKELIGLPHAQGSVVKAFHLSQMGAQNKTIPKRFEWLSTQCIRSRFKRLCRSIRMHQLLYSYLPGMRGSSSGVVRDNESHLKGQVEILKKEATSRRDGKDTVRVYGDRNPVAVFHNRI